MIEQCTTRFIKLDDIIINTYQITTARYIKDERWGNKWFIRLSDGDSYSFKSNPTTDKIFTELFHEVWEKDQNKGDEKWN